MKKYLYQDLYKLEDNHWWHVSKRRAVLSYIKKSGAGNLNILDVGCGAGRNMEELQKIGIVTGLDLSPLALKYCRKRGLKKLILGSAEKTLLKPGSFDVITMLDVLEHTNDNLSLKEMQRLLKKDGVLIITVPAFSWLWSEWDRVLKHKRRYTKKGLEIVLRKNNLKLIKISYMYSFLVFPAWIIRKVKDNLYKNQYPSDFRLSNFFINFFLNHLAKIELVLSGYMTIPFGTSIIALAKNEEQ